MDHKSYIDIKSFQTKFANSFNVGDEIVIEEKIDGANSSFQYDINSNSMLSFSRKQTLDPHNTLRGFFTFVNQLDISKFKKYPTYRFFGEWLVKHTVVYPDNCYKNFYLFDVYDTENQKWLDYSNVKRLSEELELSMVHVFYLGNFINWEHILKFVGKTAMGGEYGEGVVVKNMTRLNDENNRLPFYTKIVTDKFKEKAKCKTKVPLSMEVLKDIEYKKALTSSIVTLARVRKILHKLVDENILPVDWELEDMSKVAKNLPMAVYKDCQKEEQDIINKVGDDFGKYSSALSLKLAKEILLSI